MAVGGEQLRGGAEAVGGGGYGVRLERRCESARAWAKTELRGALAPFKVLNIFQMSLNLNLG